MVFFFFVCFAFWGGGGRACGFSKERLGGIEVGVCRLLDRKVKFLPSENISFGR